MSGLIAGIGVGVSAIGTGLSFGQAASQRKLSEFRCILSRFCANLIEEGKTLSS